VSNTVFIDGVLGDDLTAERGNASKPCETIAQAKILAQDFDNIIIWTDLVNQVELGISTKKLQYYSFAREITFTNFVFQNAKNLTCFYGLSTKLTGANCSVTIGDVNIYCYALQLSANVTVSNGWSLYVETRREIDGAFTCVNVLVNGFSQFCVKNAKFGCIELRLIGNFSGGVLFENVFFNGLIISTGALQAAHYIQLINVIFLSTVDSFQINIIAPNIFNLFVIGRIDTKFDFFPNPTIIENKLSGWLYNYEPNLIIRTPFTFN
jgi:hypothetical protein